MDSTRLIELLKKERSRTLTPCEVIEIRGLKNQMQVFIAQFCKTPLEVATMEKRFLEGKQWEKIANELLDSSADAPRKRAYRTLKRVRH